MRIQMNCLDLGRTSLYNLDGEIQISHVHWMLGLVHQQKTRAVVVLNEGQSQKLLPILRIVITHINVKSLCIMEED